MGLHSRDDLEEIISLLKENIVLSKDILRKNPANKDIKRLLEAQKKDFKK